jgi:hypothetical protein
MERITLRRRSFAQTNTSERPRSGCQTGRHSRSDREACPSLRALEFRITFAGYPIDTGSCKVVFFLRHPPFTERFLEKDEMTDAITIEPVTVTVPVALRISGLGRTKFYQLLAEARFNPCASPRAGSSFLPV